MVSLRLQRFLMAAITAAAAVTGCATLDTWERKALFQHERSALYGESTPPVGGQAYDLRLAQGDKVHAWYLPAAQKDAPTLLFLHGARRNLTGSSARIELLRSLGFHVLAIDYRGFGQSTALLPSEQTAVEDTLAAFEELQRREPDPRRRFVYGYSLGGALAIDLASRGNGIAGLIVEASFTSVPDIVRATRWGWVPGLDRIVTQDFNSLEKMPRVRAPLLLLHGTADGIVPHEMSDRLYAAASGVPPELRRIIKFDGASHRGSPFVGGERYAQAVREFVATARRAAMASIGLH